MQICLLQTEQEALFGSRLSAKKGVSGVRSDGNLVWPSRHLSLIGTVLQNGNGETQKKQWDRPYLPEDVAFL